MSGEPRGEDGTLLRRVPVIVRSWDGPNSRVGLEMDLSQMPWGPFDALGKRLSLLLPASDPPEATGSAPESQVERALRHVEHASDRCAEFSQLANGDQELWRRSYETWEWIRKYLTSLWVDTDVEGSRAAPAFADLPADPGVEVHGPGIPPLPGAAATLNAAASALRATPLSAWGEIMDSSGPEAPTREEAVQTLLGVARVLERGSGEGTEPRDMGPGSEMAPTAEAGHGGEEGPAAPEEHDPDQLSFEFAKGYDEGYQMGRRVGLALGARSRPG